MRPSAKVKGTVIAALFALTCIVWYAALCEGRAGRLTVSFLKLGGGSAIFIDAPSGRQALIDGGQDGSVLRSLGGAMPPYDRSIDVVVAASANQKQNAGLIDVLRRYAVRTVAQTGVASANPAWHTFEKEAARARIVSARRGQVYDLGKGTYLEILFPDRAAPSVAPEDGCVVSRLTYGSTSFLFACEASEGVQRYLAMLDGTRLRSDVLIMSSTPSPIFLGYVEARYAASSTSATFVSDGRAIRKK